MPERVAPIANEVSVLAGEKLREIERVADTTKPGYETYEGLGWYGAIAQRAP
jgi:hypothetical protein